MFYCQQSEGGGKAGPQCGAWKRYFLGHFWPKWAKIGRIEKLVYFDSFVTSGPGKKDFYDLRSSSPLKVTQMALCIKSRSKVKGASHFETYIHFSYRMIVFRIFFSICMKYILFFFPIYYQSAYLKKYIIFMVQ